MSHHLCALSPLDGRYAQQVSALSDYFSEYALIKYRVAVEIQWLAYLSDCKDIPECPELSTESTDKLLNAFSPEDAEKVKSLEATTNHDVKAVEYFLRDALPQTPALQAFIHFACTSEDINNLSYALMLTDAKKNVLIPSMNTTVDKLKQMAEAERNTPMLARTHGQTASPTTLGKELLNVVNRLNRQIEAFEAHQLLGKMNGAVGNFNAHHIAYPDVDWPHQTKSFVESLGLAHNAFTTQIEPHDCIAEYAHHIMRFNTILIDLCRDIWSYISVGVFTQKLQKNEVGSSTMPHKVNPIDFENAEGNLGLANALLDFFAQKLPISRWQRDLSDSTVLRNIGVAIGHTHLALQSIQKGLNKLTPNHDFIKADLENRWEVLAEAVQTVMRKHGTVDAYEQLKTFTRGEPVTKDTLHAFIDSTDLPSEEIAQLKALTPETYIGLAAVLV